MAVNSTQDSESLTGEMSANESDHRQRSSPFRKDLETADELHLLRLKIERLQNENQSEIGENCIIGWTKSEY